MPRISPRRTGAPSTTPPAEEAPAPRRARRNTAAEEEAPSNRGSRRAPSEQDTRPARGARPSRGSRDYGPSATADDSAEDEYYEDASTDAYTDDARVDAEDAKVGGAGWGASARYREETRGTGVNRVKFDKGETVVGVFMEPSPFNSYTQRWVEAAGRSFVGLKHDDPLEKLGVEAKAYSAFNFVPLASTSDKRDEMYQELGVWVLQASPALVKQLEPDESARGSKAQPLDAPGRFAEVRYYTKDNGWGDYEVTWITADQLGEYWNLDAPSEKDLADLAEDCLKAEDFPSLPTRAEVEAAAAKIANADRPGARRGR